MSPRSRAAGEALVEGDKHLLCCFYLPALLLFPMCHPQLSRGQAGSWRASNILQHTRAINVGCRCCLMGHMPNKPLGMRTRGVGCCSSRSTFLFLLLVTQPSLSTSALSISTDRSLWWLQIIVSVWVFKSSLHHPEEFNLSEPDGEIAAFITTRCRTSLFRSHLEK